MKRKFFCGFVITFCIVFCFCTFCYLYGQEEEYSWMALCSDDFLAARKELGIETTDKLDEYYKNMFGKNFSLKNTGYIFMGRAVGYYPINPDEMDVFKDMIFAPYTYLDVMRYGTASFLGHYRWRWEKSYFVEKYLPDVKLPPVKYYLAQHDILRDMLYWEWAIEDIRFRVLETHDGMLIWIMQDGFDKKTEISDKECANILLKTIKINCKDTDDICKQFKLPPQLREGDVFSNVKNLDKLVNAKILLPEFQNEFPRPTDGPKAWSNQLVGFITKGAICLIIVHVEPPQASFPLKPTILDSTNRWLSGRILRKDMKTLVLPRGLTKIPQSWQPVLEDNEEEKKWGLKLAEQRRIEESKWRVWHDKNGKPLFDGKKMKLEYWRKPSIHSGPNLVWGMDQDFKSDSVTMEIRNDPNFNRFYFPLSEFSAEDKKLILEMPPMEFNGSEPTVVGSSNDKDLLKPKTPEPEPDDIE
ncbi:MAG: hypothetical protein LBC02_05980 [Planctomycetaceae bacterium]|nr:hypothetical protein [Planctomycetaceae bacterium]